MEIKSLISLIHLVDQSQLVFIPIHLLEQLRRQQVQVQRHLLETVTEVLFLMYQQEKETLLVIK